MTLPDLPPQVADIRNAVKSAATCDSSTVSSLSRILAPEQNETLCHNASTDGAPKRGSSKRDLIPQATKGKQRAKTFVIDVAHQEEDCLDFRRKLVLATDIVNLTLKALTEATKTPAPQQKAKTMTEAAPRSKSKASFGDLAAQPLQQRCINRVPKSPQDPPDLRRSSSTKSIDQEPGLIAQAECARLALKALRTLGARKDSVTALPYLQVESGMSALIGKLIALGLNDMAMKELQILKRRLDTDKEDKSSSPQSLKDNLAELLRFENSSLSDAKMIALMATTQLQTLRLIAAMGRPAIVEAGLEHLQLDKPYAPANTILAMAADEPAKAVKQLETLAQLLLSLCPSVSSAEDEKIAAQKFSTSPKTALRLQMLAFDIRSKWWRLSKHQADVSKELTGPFSRCLAAFCRRSPLAAETTYSIAKGAFHHLHEMLQAVSPGVLGITAIPGASSSSGSVFETLADIAQAAHCFADATEWLLEFKSVLFAAAASKSRICRVSCRVASLSLQDKKVHDSGLDLTRLLSEAAKGLEGDFCGESSADLDNLFTAVVGLRRSCAFAVQNLIQDHASAEEPIMPEVRSRCLQILQLCPNFFYRYLGDTPSLSDDERVKSQYRRRKEFVIRAAEPSIGSVVAIANISLSSGKLDWAKVDLALQDCAKLARAIGRLDPESKLTTEDERRGSPFISLSNAYWCHYLKIKSRTTQLSNIRRCLQQSTELLADRNLSERQAGFLQIKYERLGKCYDESGYGKLALGAYRAALRIQMESGLLSLAARSANFKPPSEVLGTDSGAAAFGRVLSVQTKTALRLEEGLSVENVVFDDGVLSPEERGLLLEWQLGTLTSMIFAETPSEILLDTIQYISSLTLTIYTREHYPVRRLRVQTGLLRLISDHPEVLGLVIGDCRLDEIAYLDTDTAHADVGLERFKSHFIASRIVYLAFREKHPTKQSFEPALASWSQLVQECPGWNLIRDRISEPGEWLKQLDSIAAYLTARGQDMSAVAVLHLISRAYELQEAGPTGPWTSKLLDLGLRYSRLGYSGWAGLALHRAQQQMEIPGTPTSTVLQWHLIYAEYLLDIGNIKKSEEYFSKARSLMKDVDEFRSSGSTTLTKRARLVLLYADIAQMHSYLASSKGCSQGALDGARRCVKLHYRAWAVLEKLGGWATRKTPAKISDSDTDSVTDSLLALSGSKGPSVPIMSTTHDSLKGAAFWVLIPKLFRSLVNLSQLLAHEGLLPEALYYAEQSRKIADAVDAHQYQMEYFALAGDYQARQGEISSSLENFERAVRSVESSTNTMQYAILQCLISATYARRCDWENQGHAAESANLTINEIMSVALVDEHGCSWSRFTGLATLMKGLSLQETPTLEASDASRGLPKDRSMRKKRTTVHPVNVPQKANFAGCIPLLRLKGRILREQAISAIRRKSLDSAENLLMEADQLPKGLRDIISQAVITTQLNMRQAFSQMTVDPVFCILHESTISHPSATSKKPYKAEKNSKLQSRGPGGVKQLNPSPAKGLTRKITRPHTPPLRNFVSFLKQAQDSICIVQRMSSGNSPVAIVHVISDLLGKITMMLASACPMQGGSNVNSAFVVYSIELGRMAAMLREKAAILTERRVAEVKNLLCWPVEYTADEKDTLVSIEYPQYSRFQTDYIDIIPVSWTVLSISLSDSRDELRICKTRAGQTPFVLAIPLNRHNSRDIDEEIFTFDNGKAELMEIIDLANYSCHNAVDMSRKGASTEWWEARSALDARLKDLLINIENTWFGGFRGIFSPHFHSHELVSRFYQSFHNILDKHLPSRQGIKKTLEMNRVSLDTRVVELFLNLGDPTETVDFEEPLTDLLYFVVDILQFHGERNAYDEIDFDSISVETIDTLRQYHEAAKRENKSCQGKHIILVLDKALHCFPWESLPCLDGIGVSRLPSFACLRERILLQHTQQQTQKPCEKDDGLHINRQNGAYMLNPGGDLKATEEHFRQPLQLLPEWESITRREPEEAEMRDCLQDRDLFLYFGHGSGGQYIRARTIKKLTKCAVALLMGCSSGTLTETGEFEPYGMPISYMHAGCPALVATLWDVTDKDIDRFSHSVLERWGLFDTSTLKGPTSPTKKSARRRCKGRGKESDKASICDVSLDRAVAGGRESCLLRYINGAAPVVYGVPVFLA